LLCTAAHVAASLPLRLSPPERRYQPPCPTLCYAHNVCVQVGVAAAAAKSTYDFISGLPSASTVLAGAAAVTVLGLLAKFALPKAAQQAEQQVSAATTGSTNSTAAAESAAPGGAELPLAAAAASQIQEGPDAAVPGSTAGQLEGQQEVAAPEAPKLEAVTAGELMCRAKSCCSLACARCRQALQLLHW